MEGEPFAVTGLSSRGGFRNGSAFFFADRAVLCDHDLVNALHGLFGTGPAHADVAAWCEAACASAKRVLVVPDAEIQSVRIGLRMWRNELWIARAADPIESAGYRGSALATPRVHRYELLRREDTDPASRLLAARFGPRFELATTRAYAFFHTIAPVLTR